MASGQFNEVTEATQEEMKKTLRKLSAHHQKAKLLQFFERQDQLRPHPATISKRPKHRRSRSVPDFDDIEAMKSQFKSMHQETLASQFQKQMMLRIDDGADGDVETELTEFADCALDPDGVAAAFKSSSRPNSDGEHRLDCQDVEEMRKEFQKLHQQRIMALTKVTPTEDDEDMAERVHVLKLSKRDSEEMQDQFRRLSKAQIEYSTLKQLETRVSGSQIKPSHKQRFKNLMQDIGIVNESVTDGLWSNIENTVQFGKVSIGDGNDPNEVQSLKQEVNSLREEMALLKAQMKTMQSIPDSGRESQDMAGILSMGSDDEKDDDAEMIIID